MADNNPWSSWSYSSMSSHEDNGGSSSNQTHDDTGGSEANAYDSVLQRMAAEHAQNPKQYVKKQQPKKFPDSRYKYQPPKEQWRAMIESGNFDTQPQKFSQSDSFPRSTPEEYHTLSSYPSDTRPPKEQWKSMNESGNYNTQPQKFSQSHSFSRSTPEEYHTLSSNTSNMQPPIQQWKSVIESGDFDTPPQTFSQSGSFPRSNPEKYHTLSSNPSDNHKSNLPQNTDQQFQTRRCSVCDMHFNSESAYELHTRGLLHQSKVNESNKGKNNAENSTKPTGTADKDDDDNDDDDLTQCKVCNVQFKSPSVYYMHIRGVSHHSRVAEAKEKKANENKTAESSTEVNPQSNKQFSQNFPSGGGQSHKNGRNPSVSAGSAGKGEDDDGDEYGNWKFCEECKLPFKSPAAFLMHTRGLIHIAKVAEASNKEKPDQQSGQPQQERQLYQSDGSQNTFHCDLCDMNFMLRQGLNTHLRSEQHKKQLHSSQGSWFGGAGSQYSNEDYEPLSKKPRGSNPAEESTETPDNKTLGMMYCKVCNVPLSGQKSWDQHVNGAKHFKRISQLGEGGAESKQALGKFQRMTIPTKEVNIQMVVDNCQDEPLIGLDYISEHHFLSRKQECRYFCQLCQSKTDPRIFLSHVTGLKHRRRYLKYHYTDMWQDLSNVILKKKMAGTAYARELAQKVEQMEGRFTVRLRIEVTDEKRKKNKEDPTLQHWDDGTVWEENELPMSKCRPISELPGILAEDEEDDVKLIVVKKSKTNEPVPWKEREKTKPKGFESGELEFPKSRGPGQGRGRGDGHGRGNTPGSNRSRHQEDSQSDVDYNEREYRRMEHAGRAHHGRGNTRGGKGRGHQEDFQSDVDYNEREHRRMEHAGRARHRMGHPGLDHFRPGRGYMDHPRRHLMAEEQDRETLALLDRYRRHFAHPDYPRMDRYQLDHQRMDRIRRDRLYAELDRHDQRRDVYSRPSMYDYSGGDKSTVGAYRKKLEETGQLPDIPDRASDYDTLPEDNKAKFKAKIALEIFKQGKDVDGVLQNMSRDELTMLLMSLSEDKPSKSESRSPFPSHTITRPEKDPQPPPGPGLLPETGLQPGHRASTTTQIITQTRISHEFAAGVHNQQSSLIEGFKSQSIPSVPHPSQQLQIAPPTSSQSYSRESAAWPTESEALVQTANNPISGMNQCAVDNEKEAEIALQVSSQLTKALLDYRRKRMNQNQAAAMLERRSQQNQGTTSTVATYPMTSGPTQIAGYREVNTRRDSDYETSAQSEKHNPGTTELLMQWNAMIKNRDKNPQ